MTRIHTSGSIGKFLKTISNCITKWFYNNNYTKFLLLLKELLTRLAAVSSKNMGSLKGKCNGNFSPKPHPADDIPKHIHCTTSNTCMIFMSLNFISLANVFLKVSYFPLRLTITPLQYYANIFNSCQCHKVQIKNVQVAHLQLIKETYKYS